MLSKKDPKSLAYTKYPYSILPHVQNQETSGTEQECEGEGGERDEGDGESEEGGGGDERGGFSPVLPSPRPRFPTFHQERADTDETTAKQKEGLPSFKTC